MRLPIRWVLPLVAFLLAGCLVTSLNPLYTPKDLVFDPRLVGTWSEEKGSETWTFEAQDNRSYLVTIQDENGQKAILQAHLLRLKERLYFDLLLAEHPLNSNPDLRLNAYAAYSMVPAHVFMQVAITNAAIELAHLDSEWLAKQLKSNPGLLDHRWIEDNLKKNDEKRVLLTGSTRQLQRFMIRNADNPDVFPKPARFIRRVTSK